MSRDPNQLFVINAISRNGIAEELSSIISMMQMTHHAGKIELLPDDDDLTDEICQAYASAIGNIDPSDSEEFVSDQEHKAMLEALESMGWVELPKEDDDVAERLALLAEIADFERQLTLKRARLQQIENIF